MGRLRSFLTQDESALEDARNGEGDQEPAWEIEIFNLQKSAKSRGFSRFFYRRNRNMTYPVEKAASTLVVAWRELIKAICYATHFV